MSSRAGDVRTVKWWSVPIKNIYFSSDPFTFAKLICAKLIANGYRFITSLPEE